MIPYSPTEEALLRILKSRKRLNTNEIIEKFYSNRPRSFYARQYLNARLRDLIMKVKHNRESFRIERTKRSGPNPLEFWIEPKED